MEVLYEVVLINNKLISQRVDIDTDNSVIIYGTKEECDEYIEYMNNLNHFK